MGANKAEERALRGFSDEPSIKVSARNMGKASSKDLLEIRWVFRSMYEI
jgi:hypothetical protein